MTDKTPDFRELVGDLPEEERARLERVHELLLAAGPRPSCRPRSSSPISTPREEDVQFLPRRRAGLVLGIAAAVGVAAFLGGFIAGRHTEPFTEVFTVPMHGTAQAANASATIQVGKADVGRQLAVEGPRPRPEGAAKGQYYEMFLHETGKPAATCGTFRIAQSGDRSG